MELLIFSDLHIHNYKAFNENGDRLDNCLRVLMEMFETAAAQGISHILFVGDLYDQQQAIPPIVINNTIEVFKALFDEYPEILFIAITGNHDQSTKNLKDAPAVSSIQHLDTIFENFKVIDNSYMVLEDLITVYGIPYYSHQEHFQQAIPGPGMHDAILLIHQTPRHSNEMIPYECTAEQFSEFDYVFCGHIHKYERLADNFEIVGSPLHRDLGDEGQDKGYLIYNTDTKTTQRVLLDYPKFERPVVEFTEQDTEVDRLTEDSFARASHKEDLIKEYAETIGLEVEILNAGLKVLS